MRVSNRAKRTNHLQVNFRAQALIRMTTLFIAYHRLISLIQITEQTYSALEIIG